MHYSISKLAEAESVSTIVSTSVRTTVNHYSLSSCQMHLVVSPVVSKAVSNNSKEHNIKQQLKKATQERSLKMMKTNGRHMFHFKTQVENLQIKSNKCRNQASYTQELYKKSKC